MVRIEDTLWCDGCGVEITWTPERVGRGCFCCQDCAEGRECECGQRIEQEEEHRAGAALMSAYE